MTTLADLYMARRRELYEQLEQRRFSYGHWFRAWDAKVRLVGAWVR